MNTHIGLADLSMHRIVEGVYVTIRDKVSQDITVWHGI